MNWTAADLRYMSDACFDEGVNVPEWRVEKYAEELENRIGEEPTEDQVIAYAVAESHALAIDAAGIARIPTHKDAPEELWIVTDKDGDLARVCNSAKDAETVRAYRQLDLPSLAPHFVTHYRRVPL